MSSSREPRWWQRYATELLVLALGLVVVVGLWVRNRPDDRPSSSPAATTTTEPTSTTTPAGEDPADAEAPEPVADGAGARSLAEAVLRDGDLPSGWSPVVIREGAIAPLCEGRDPFAAVPPEGSARAAFSRGSSGEAISGTVARFADRDAAASLLARIREDARACGGGGATYALAALAGVGDEGLKVTISVSVGGGTLRTLVTVARAGEHVAVITATGQPDEALAVRALRAELGRL